MAEIIAFVSPKGGCGSTFMCAGLWNSFANNSKKVLAVDFCFEKGTLDFNLGFQNDYIYTLSDCLDKSTEFSDVLVGYPDKTACFVKAGYEYIPFNFKKLIKYFEGFDYVLIDMPPIDDIASEIIPSADTVVCVTDLSEVSLKICDSFLSSYETDNCLLAINKVIPSYCAGGIHYTVDEAMDFLGIPLLGIVPWTPKAEIVLKQSFKYGIEDETADKAFNNMTKRLTGETVRACEFKNVYDCFKLKKDFSLKAD
jgi:septum site-determining protein MinD